ncbi:hypothetical protein BKA61DRAFT_652360 [Leptodontidium sp. MPI-SDFR-AT-0119]|nr:hypothetical protein BKA61DRAFT_652360 [Leptodontidium sp. MPI-SDFR-AT-0119]
MKTAHLSTLAFTSLFIDFFPAASASSSCYYPRGVLALDVPCDTSTSGHSAGCGKGASCLSSGLCFNEGVISRGDYNPTGGAPIIINQLASDNDIGKLKWRCGFPLENNGTCKQGAAISVTAGTMVAIAGVTATSTISTSTSASGTATSTSLGSSSAIPTQDTANASSTLSADEKFAANHGVAIGAGVGIPLGLAALAMLSLFLRERKMRKAEKSEGDMQRSLQGGHGAYQGSHVVSGVPGGMM